MENSTSTSIDMAKSILVKVPMDTYLRMKKVQTERFLHALRNNDHKKIRLDEMVLEAIEEKFAEEAA